MKWLTSAVVLLLIASCGKVLCVAEELPSRTPSRLSARTDSKQQSRQARTELIKDDDPRVAVAGYTTQFVEGWAVRVSDDLMTREKEATRVALRLLRGQLKGVKEVLPPAALAQVRTVPIWLSPTYSGFKPTAEYHPQRQWLRKNGRHRDMYQCVELTNIPIFEQECRCMPLMVLHELAHAYHDQVLGFKHPEIRAAWQRAVNSGTYDSVARTGYEDQRAYAMTNQMEYFAETSEAYFGTNDFFPFDRAQLERHDPEMHRLLARFWIEDVAE